MGPQWKDWPQKASARPRQHRGTQRRDFAHHPHFRAERWQTRTASHASASAHCLRGKCLGAEGGRCAEDPCRKGLRPPKAQSWDFGKTSCCAVPSTVTELGLSVALVEGDRVQDMCQCSSEHTSGDKMLDLSTCLVPCCVLQAWIWRPWIIAVGEAWVGCLGCVGVVPVCSCQHREYIPHIHSVLPQDPVRGSLRSHVRTICRLLL